MILRCALLLSIGLVIYAQTFRFGFVFDDDTFVLSNPFIANFSNFPEMLKVFPWTRSVGLGSFTLNYYFNQLNPQGYHIFNFMVHLVAVGLVWALADLLFKITKWPPANNPLTKELPFVIALLFLVHPCQTQAVSYITQRFESMATVFYLATAYVYLRARLSENRRHKLALGGLAGLLMILGILTKEVVITIPLMILALEWILFPTKRGKRFYVGLVTAGIVLYLLFTQLVRVDLGIFSKLVTSQSHDGDVLTSAGYMLTQMRVFLTFLRLMVLPMHQTLDYDYAMSTGILHPPLTLVGLIVIGCMIWLTIKLRRKLPLVSCGLAWMLITFSINLMPRANVIFEHKLYLISFGFFLAGVVALSALVSNRPTVLKILWCAIVILAVVSFERNKVWANELSLWENNIKRTPNKARVNINLARAYGSLNRYDEAIAYYNRALAINPTNVTYENRGVIYFNQGRFAEALADFNKSIDMDPKYFLTYTKRAWVYKQLHNHEAALADLERAEQLAPNFPDIYVMRGRIWMELGNHEKAFKNFEHAKALDPTLRISINRRGN